MRAPMTVALVVALAATAAPTPAGAAEEYPVPPGPAGRGPTWYGWQILPVDVALVTALVYTPERRQGRIAWLGASLLVTGPVVHALHANYGRAAISLGVRVGVPLAAVYALSAGCRDDECDVAFALGMLLSMPLVFLADWVVLPWETRPPRATPTTPARRLVLLPSVAGGPGLLLSGTF